MNLFPDEKIIDFLENKLTKNEKREFENWILSSDTNKGYFEDFKKIYDSTQKLRLEFSPDEIGALRKVKQKLKYKLIITWAQRIAAILIVTAILGKFLMPTLIQTRWVKIVATEQQTLFLPDSSMIILTKNSRLKYRKNFNGEYRNVDLDGKAYFEVKPDSLKPFIVSTELTQIKVLGTRFLVDATEKNTQKVIVDFGKVLFASRQKKENSIELHKNEIGEFNLVKNSIQKSTNIDLNFNASFSKKLVFDKATLSEVISDFEKYYNTKINILDNKIETLRFSGTFNNNSLSEALETLSLTLDINIHKANSNYIITQ